MNRTKPKAGQQKTHQYKPIPKRKFCLPPGCTLAFPTPKQRFAIECGDGEGVKILCTPDDWPVVKQVNLRPKEVCFLVR